MRWTGFGLHDRGLSLLDRGALWKRGGYEVQGPELWHVRGWIHKAQSWVDNKR